MSVFHQMMQKGFTDESRATPLLTKRKRKSNSKFGFDIFPQLSKQKTTLNKSNREASTNYILYSHKDKSTSILKSKSKCIALFTNKSKSTFILSLSKAPFALRARARASALYFLTYNQV